MIDKIKILVKGQIAPSLLTNKNFYSENTFIGKLENLRIRQGYENVFIEGSLSKYFTGNNYHNLTRQEIADALENLQNQIKLDFSTAKLLEVEFGFSLVMNHTPAFYFKSWGEMAGRYDKCIYSQNTKGITGIGYSNNTLSFTGYDKTLTDKIPMRFTERNVLRLELRLKKGLNRLYNISNPLELSEIETLKRISSIFEKLYNKIPKGQTVYIPDTIDLKPKTVTEILFQEGLQTIGYSEFNSMIADRYNSGTLAKKNYERIRARIRQPSPFLAKDDFTMELNTKVFQQLKALK